MKAAVSTGQVQTGYIWISRIIPDGQFIPVQTPFHEWVRRRTSTWTEPAELASVVLLAKWDMVDWRVFRLPNWKSSGTLDPSRGTALQHEVQQQRDKATVQRGFKVPGDSLQGLP